MTRNDSDILAANEHTVWTILVIGGETTHRGEYTRFLASASSETADRALMFARCQAEYTADATIYQRTKANGWRKRAVSS